MTRPRRTLVNPSDTPYYHVIGRCVRQAYLCGRDHFSGKDYKHRRQWILERLALLSRAFTVDVCAYAVMSNHYHLVVKLNPGKTESLSDESVMERWALLFALPLRLVRYRQGLITSDAEARTAREAIACLRERLGDLAWFMRCLNEYIARRANTEDGCTGRFWEGRYKSQALLDEAALLTCMSYVDLNPIRAGVANAPEASEFTSIEQRIRNTGRAGGSPSGNDHHPAVPLLAFTQMEDLTAPDHLPFTFQDYLELVDWTGRHIREGKQGAIPAETPPILTRLGIDAEHYRKTQHRSRSAFGIAMGCIHSLKRTARNLGQSYIHGMNEARRLFRLRPT